MTAVAVTRSVAPPRPGVLHALLASPANRLALAVVVVLVLLTLGAPWLSPHDPLRMYDPVALRHQPPSWRFPFGTDAFSRDLLSRTMAGGRHSLVVAVSAVVLGTGVGTFVGLACGLLGGVVDRVLMRLVDVLLAIPRVLLLLLVLALVGRPSVSLVIGVLAATGWMATSRLVRGEVRAMAQDDRLRAARALGVPRGRLVTHHVLPWLVPLLAVTATGALGQVLLLETGLAYLGLGVSPPTPSWGDILRDVSDVVGPSRWLALGPGLWVVLLVAAVQRLGDGLQSAFDRVHHVAAS